MAIARWRWSRILGVVLVLGVITPPLVAVGYIVLGERISTTARNAYVGACEGQNEVRHEVVAFVESTLERSARATKATLSAPQSTEAQKVAASRNLADLAEFDRQITHALSSRDCTYPPPPKGSS